MFTNGYFLVHTWAWSRKNQKKKRKKHNGKDQKKNTRLTAKKKVLIQFV